VIKHTFHDYINEVTFLRYAFDGSAEIKTTIRFDVVIVGAGLAGLYTALGIDERFACCVLAKEEIDVSNSWLAQGGIAAAVSSDDDPSLHFDDTLIAGAGLCDREAVRVLVDEAPGEIARLVSRGVPFDLDDAGELSITREGGHRKNRVLHAGGDATGRETVKALSHLAAKRPNITFCAHTCFYDILLGPDGAVSGAVVTRDGELVLIETSNIVIATGGIGRVYKNSTNPSIATGDGIAAAMRAGAGVKNLEFIQFHPTGLWTPEDEERTFLISEAVRGDGGLLKNSRGERFMTGQHELGELAPRDIVARGIFRELESSGEDHVFVDITAKDADFIKRRFPTIYSECLSRGVDITRDWIPVRPVQHYLMGGIRTDLWGRTDIPGLYACGEAAYTGVHGANRLASNSMLECLVFGRRAAEDINRRPPGGESAKGSPLSGAGVPVRNPCEIDLDAVLRQIQELMSEHGYVIRTKSGLTRAFAEVREILSGLGGVFSPSPRYLETLNVASVAEAVLAAALARDKSVGSHYIES
jgi:L-aspartate oxidase